MGATSKIEILSGFPEHPAVANTCAIALLASPGAIPCVFNAGSILLMLGSDKIMLRSGKIMLGSGKIMLRSGKIMLRSGKIKLRSGSIR